VTIEILQEAEDELNASVIYYEDIEAGLGIRLKEEACAAIRWIAENPEVPRLRTKGYRRGLPEGESQSVSALRCLPHLGVHYLGYCDCARAAAARILAGKEKADRLSGSPYLFHQGTARRFVSEP